MSDSQLKEYIPAYGDRISTVAFCKSLEDKSVLTKENLVEKIKLNLNYGGKNQYSRLMGNKYAKKMHRRIELGWKNFDSYSNTYKQVRSQKGGGIRHLSVDTNVQLSELLQTGKDLFFPEGCSSQGTLDQFRISLHDYQGNPVKQQTVAEAYEETKLKLLRLHIYTKKVGL